MSHDGCPAAGPTTFATGVSQFGAIYSDGTYLYWGASDDTLYWISRRKLDASAAAEKLVTTAGHVTSYASDASYLYWGESNAYFDLAPDYLMKVAR